MTDTLAPNEASPGGDSLAPLQRRRNILRAGLAGGLCWIAGTRLASAQQAAPAVPSGQVTMEQTQVSLLANAGWGSGTLTYQGHSYRFRLHNLGVGGIGYSKLSARGNVFGLTRVEDFAGLYGVCRRVRWPSTISFGAGSGCRTPAG